MSSRRYFHSKGVTHHITAPEQTPNVRLWRYVMEYHLMARWRRCIELLESHDVVGESLLRLRRPHKCCLTSRHHDSSSISEPVQVLGDLRR